MRMLVALVLTAFLAVVTIGAQTQSMNLGVGMSAPLRPLSEVNLDKTGQEKCGPYFNYTGTPTESGKVGLVTLVAVSTTGDGSRGITILPWGTDKFQVRVDDSLNVPQVKILRMGGPVYPWAEISISSKDLRGASCLSHSKLVRGTSAGV